MEHSNLIRMGFIAGGLANFAGVLTATMCFTNPLVAAQFPEVFSDFGMLSILLWGMAYIAVSRHYQRVLWLVAVFAVEKLAYTATWFFWLMYRNPGFGSLYDQSFVTGLFYSVYGANDLLFALFFGWVFMQSRRHPIADARV